MKMCEISVIVPVYNAGKYIKKCIISIVGQTYHNFEIIAVDDGSTDNSLAVLRSLADEYTNLKIITHEKNRGLFQARITGVINSKGKYIAFVDADDFISVDWLRLLYDKIRQENADIAIGQFVCDFENGRAGYYNLDPLRTPLVLEGEEVFASFMHQQGLFFSWHVVWNKLYRRELWMSVLPELQAFSEKQRHLVLYEDLAFSVALWMRAKKVCNIISGALYFYYKHSEAATSFAKNRKQLIKKIQDAKAAFDFFGSLLTKEGKTEVFEADYREWVHNHASILFLSSGTKEKRYRETLISSAFGVDIAQILDKRRKKDIDFFGSICTQADREDFLRLDSIKQRICSEKISVVSFDIFDTLLLRPFYYPSDLFCLLNDDFKKLNGNTAYIDFSQIRKDCEHYCREELRERKDGAEEVTLDEIYDCIASRYGVRRDVIETLKERERKLELRFCYPRESARQLFELARQQNKKVILCSDIYLDEAFVNELLQKNGYKGYTLFLSSELRLTKHRGSLFHYVRKQLRIRSEGILHIGDNTFSDIEQAKGAGWNAVQLPRCVDVFEGRFPDIYGGDLLKDIALNKQSHDMECAKRHLGYRTALALIANKMFDDPFLPINKDTNFNADPYLVGYSALGPYLYAIAQWIGLRAREKGCGTVHFVARDGYLPKLAYEIITGGAEGAPKTNYLYLSRKALLLADIVGQTDLYALSAKLNPCLFSRKKLFELLIPILKDQYATADEEKLCGLLRLQKSLFRRYFADRREFDTCITEYLPLIDSDKLRCYREGLVAFFSEQIKEGDILFDIGYSGRNEAVLTPLLGFPVNSLYVHGNEEVLQIRQKEYGFENETFYGYKPVITGVIREHVFMKLAPSVVGYREKEGALRPVFGEEEPNYTNAEITKAVQRAALSFVWDMQEKFLSCGFVLPCRKEDLAYIFEYLLHFSKPLDREIFKGVQFEDGLLVAEKNFCLVDFWNEEIEKNGLGHYCDCPGKKNRLRRWADKLLPYGTHRRAVVKKIYNRLMD